LEHMDYSYPNPLRSMVILIITLVYLVFNCDLNEKSYIQTTLTHKIGAYETYPL